MTITATAPRAAAYRGRLRWWTELPLIAVMYALYSGARLLVRGDVSDAVQHGADILHFEQIVHLDPEHWFNRLFTDHAFLGVPADFAYASLHYIVTPTVLVWLWRRRPTHYRTARTWLALSTLIGLVGFTLLPTAPPRLLTGHRGFIDTMAQYGSYGWWGTDASAPRGMGNLTNQYAAMPSLHVGWSLWCGIMLFRYGRHWTVRTLGVIYPLMTAFVVMGTANHYLLDAAAGVLVMGLGFLLARPALRLVDGVYARFDIRRKVSRDAAADDTDAVAGTAVAVAEPATAESAAGLDTDTRTASGSASDTAAAAVAGPGAAYDSSPPASATQRGAAENGRAGSKATPTVPRPLTSPDANTGNGKAPESGAALPGGEPATRG